MKYGSNYHDIYCDGKQAADANSDADQLFVKLQNYTVADRIVTIGTKAINTQISFGINGCVASNNKTSLDEVCILSRMIRDKFWPLLST